GTQPKSGGRVREVPRPAVQMPPPHGRFRGVDDDGERLPGKLPEPRATPPDRGEEEAADDRPEPGEGEVLRRAGGPVGVVSRTHEPRHLRRLAEYPDGEGGVRRALQVLVEHDVLGKDRAAGAV